MTSAGAPATPGFCFSAGAVLRRSLTTLGKRPLPFLGLAGMTVLPADIFSAFVRFRHLVLSWCRPRFCPFGGAGAHAFVHLLGQHFSLRR